MAQFLVTIAGAAQFGANYVDFSDVMAEIENAENPDLVPVITSLSFDTGDESVTVSTLVVRLNRANPDSASESVLVRNLTDTPGFAMLGCKIPVPVDPNDPSGDPTAWVLNVTTTGKTAAASLLVIYGPGVTER